MKQPKEFSFFRDNSRFFWVLLAVLALLSRSAFFLKTQIVFSSDEAFDLRFALHYGDKQWLSTLYPTMRVFDGVRYWAAILVYRFTGGWLKGGALTCVLFSWIGCCLWAWWVARKLSKRAAMVALFFMAIPPACMDYYGTMLERRQVSFVFGAILMLGAEYWFSNLWCSFGFGLLVGWAYWEDPFSLAFVAGVLLEIYLEKKWKKDGMGLMCLSLSAGLFLSGGYGLWIELKDPQYFTRYLTYGIARLSTSLERVKLLFQYFPQYWNDNMPTGYLQASRLGMASDPMSQGYLKVFFFFWTPLLFIFSLAGYFLAWKSGFKGVVISAFLPAIFLLMFFLFSDHVWDALCFRYFVYWPVAVAIGLGAMAEWAFGRKRSHILGILLAFFVIQSAIYFHRIATLPEVHPAERIIQVLDELNLKAGWANRWVSDAVNFFSNGHVCLNQYQFEPIDRKAEWLAHNSPRIAVISVEWLDRPQNIQLLLQKLEQIGYQPTSNYHFKEGWSLVELDKK